MTPNQPAARTRHGAQAGAARAPDRRRTKIVATIGPTSDAPETLAAMAAAGMDVARVPLAHGTIDEARQRIRRIREAAPSVGILADLPGPKIRSTPFPDEGVVLVPGSEVRLVHADRQPNSTDTRIGVAHDEMVDQLAEGDRIALGDGGVSLVVEERSGDEVVAVVAGGGSLKGRPGVTAPSHRVRLVTPTPEDLERMAAVVEEGVDFVAISFVRSAADLVAVRSSSPPTDAMLVAKIETAEAVGDLDGIVAEADAVMVARGDLGVRVPLEDVPHIQKDIIKSGVSYGRPVITATQMLESMITSPVPTRAEVTDVANALLDGTSAVMLSAETAIGAHPVAVIETMARILVRAEQSFDYAGWGASLGALQGLGAPSSPPRLTAAITAAAWRAALDQDAVAIIACTRTGATARAISRFRPRVPIVAATPLRYTARRLTLSWGVDALVVRESSSTDDIVWFAVEEAVRAGYAHRGDVVVVLAGSPDEAEPLTDTLRLVRVN
ncbi:MAG TPA: pyruvate kinase [Acidimicrobiales bacterium]|nr:pyruvate kinase [Acidimicrobiales bacterium]